VSIPVFCSEAASLCPPPNSGERKRGRPKGNKGLQSVLIISLTTQAPTTTTVSLSLTFADQRPAGARGGSFPPVPSSSKESTQIVINYVRLLLFFSFPPPLSPPGRPKVENSWETNFRDELLLQRGTTASRRASESALFVFVSVHYYRRNC
jgi:hypothetical protein